MGGQNSAPAEPDRVRVKYYAELMLGYLDRAIDCAEPEREDEFLWHVRRALEAGLLALLAGRGLSDPVPDKAQVDALRQALAPLPRSPFDAETQFDTIRRNSNLGAHALRFADRNTANQSSGFSEQPQIVRKYLPELLRWFAGQPELAPHLEGPIKQVIRRLSDTNGLSERQRLEASLLRAREELEHTQTALETETRKRTGKTLLTGAGLIAVGAVLGFLLRPMPEGRSVSNDYRPPPEVPRPTIPPPISPPDVPSLPVVPIARVEFPDATPSQPCPEGTTRFQGILAELRPPSDRRGVWPGRGLPAHGVTRGVFCLQNRPVNVAEFATCVRENHCSWVGAAEHEGSIPVTHVDVEQARRYCAWLGENRPEHTGARLAELEHWEISVRQGNWSRSLLVDTSDAKAQEWVDNSRPELWGYNTGAQYLYRAGAVRSPGAEPCFSWNRPQQPGAGIAGFRCVVPR